MSMSVSPALGLSALYFPSASRAALATWIEVDYTLAFNQSRQYAPMNVPHHGHLYKFDDQR